MTVCCTGFRTGSYDANGRSSAHTTSNGNIVTIADNDGHELLAYMPGAVMNTIHSTTTDARFRERSQYGHNFFVDATPGTGDVFYGGAVAHAGWSAASAPAAARSSRST